MCPLLCTGLTLLALSSATAAAPVVLDQAAAKTLVAGWVQVQNQQDFGAYRALYATKFHGIKRAGARVRSFDRDAWLADRRLMFAKRMMVTVDQVTVDVLPAMLRVRLVQKFTLDRFRD